MQKRKNTISSSGLERYYVQLHEFRNLRKSDCYLQHDEGGLQKLPLPPIDLNEKICKWWTEAKKRR